MSELVEIYKGIREVEVNGTTYPLVPIELTDIAAAQAYIVSLRIKEFMANSITIPMTDELRALTLSNIQCKIPVLLECFDAYEGKIKMLHLAVCRGSAIAKIQPIAFPEFRAKVPPIDADALWATLMWISGLGPKKAKEGEAVPLATTITPT